MFTHSIRWRLQIWHGLLLLIVLATFGYSAHQLAFENRMRQIDQELQQRASALQGAMFRAPTPPDRAPGKPKNWPEERPFRPPAANSPDKSRPGERPFEGRFGQGAGRPEWMRPGPPGEFQLPPDVQELFQDQGTGGYYFVVWAPDQKVLVQSSNVPPDLTYPALTVQAFTSKERTRGQWRESVAQTRRGSLLIVGCNILPDLEEMNRLGGLLAMLGGTILLLGLAGGWWVTHRAIRPIADISAAAREIADGKLDRRVKVQGADNELDQLAGVLNTTFDRLQSAFARQAQFTADASHELRTPIAVLISEAQTALARERTSVEYRETVEECLAVAQQMRRLTESLLDLSRFDAGQEDMRREELDLASVAAESITLVRPLSVKHGVQLDLELAPSKCLGDAQRLGQVVTNLLINAICYNKKEGHVRVRTGMEGNLALLEVIDTGIGIAAEDLPHVFDRFYRADKSRNRTEGHTGLGLAIVKAILDAHGGTIAVASEKGKGCTFTVRLPQRNSPGR
jgi:two-component system OmpR family sensor kinase